MTKNNDKGATIFVSRIETEKVKVVLVGITPFIYNAMSQKVKEELLVPPKKKNAAERAVTLKHNPQKEYQDSFYLSNEDGSPTLMVVPATMPKAALSNAALDMPGATKSQIGRLTWVNGVYLPMYGTPQIYCGAVRSADMNHTPDVRTRGILTNWAIPLVGFC